MHNSPSVCSPHNFYKYFPREWSAPQRKAFRHHFPLLAMKKMAAQGGCTTTRRSPRRLACQHRHVRPHRADQNKRKTCHEHACDSPWRRRHHNTTARPDLSKWSPQSLPKAGSRLSLLKKHHKRLRALCFYVLATRVTKHHVKSSGATFWWQLKVFFRNVCCSLCWTHTHSSITMI